MRVGPTRALSGRALLPRRRCCCTQVDRQNALLRALVKREFRGSPVLLLDVRSSARLRPDCHPSSQVQCLGLLLSALRFHLLPFPASVFSRLREPGSYASPAVAAGNTQTACTRGWDRAAGGAPANRHRLRPSRTLLPWSAGAVRHAADCRRAAPERRSSVPLGAAQRRGRGSCRRRRRRRCRGGRRQWRCPLVAAYRSAPVQGVRRPYIREKRMVLPTLRTAGFFPAGSRPG